MNNTPVIFSKLTSKKPGEIIKPQSLVESLKSKISHLISVNKLQEQQIKKLDATYHQVIDMAADTDHTNRTQNQYMAMISHEFKTPINAIIGFSDLLSETTLNDEQSEYVDRIVSGSESLLSIINNILNFSQLDYKALKMDAKPFHLVRELCDVIETLKISAMDKGLDLEFTIDPDCPTRVVGDSVSICQIITNLVQNSIKYSVSGIIKVTVDVVFLNTVNKYNLLFSISDTGKGISEENQKNIFEPYFQISKSKEQSIEGIGLGLAICKQLVTTMGGGISCKSKFGKGTTFNFNVFVEPTEDDDLLEPSGGDDAKIKIKIKPDLKILCVEDNYSNQNLIKTMLKKLGLTATFAIDGLEALEKLHSENYDIILMDVHMPNFDGLDTTRKIRSGEDGLINSNVYIIGVTAYSLVGSRDMCLWAGMNDYISKPFKINKLHEALVKAQSQIHI